MQQERAFIDRSTENRGEEAHGAGSVGQGREPREVERGQQKPARNADRFLDVVMLQLLALLREAVIEAEDDDQIGCRFEEGLVPVRA
jgi:hypothetical protein